MSCFRTADIHHFKSEICSQSLGIGDIARYVKHVASLKHSIRRSQLLSYSTKETMLRTVIATNFQYIDAIFTMHIQVYNSLTDSFRICYRLQAEQVIR